jgi:hypothetical protein
MRNDKIKAGYEQETMYLRKERSYVRKDKMRRVGMRNDIYLTKDRRKKRRIELRKGMTEGGEKTKK